MTLKAHTSLKDNDKKEDDKLEKAEQVDERRQSRKG